MTQSGRGGIGLMVAAMVVFGAQDALSRLLAAEYGIILILTIRFWFFALFVLALSARNEGGLLAVAATRRPILQVLRGVTLVAQLVLLIEGFVRIGLVESHAIFACYPLIVAVLAALVLGERVPAGRWLAIAAGAMGVLVILRPGAGVFTPSALIVLGAASIFATYSVLTRLVARHDSPQTSFFYTGVVPGLLLSIAAPFVWRPLAVGDWGWMALLCASGALGHFLLIRAYQRTQASLLQPFAYLQLVTAASLGVAVFGEALSWTTLLGSVMVVLAGLSNLWIERRRVPG
ncbi:MAG: DMT family transporter [Beijerinckiaceae bacterium]|nr:DMT family transporter [Beijerinckiaceae bacterium]